MERNFTGVDISEVAIDRARGLFPHINFIIGDITKCSISDDIVILNEVLWYVMHKFKIVLKNINCKYFN